MHTIFIMVIINKTAKKQTNIQLANLTVEFSSNSLREYVCVDSSFALIYLTEDGNKAV